MLLARSPQSQNLPSEYAQNQEYSFNAQIQVFRIFQGSSA